MKISSIKNGIVSGTASVLLCASSLMALPRTSVEINKSLTDLGDSLVPMDDYAASTVLGKNSSPVNIGGEFYNRIKDNYFTDPNTMLIADAARTQVETALNIRMAAVPNSYVNLWTQLSFQYDFSGFFSNHLAYDPNGLGTSEMERVADHHNTDYDGTTMWEELTAGIDLRSSAFAGMLKAGGVLWVNSSPLTIYERDEAPRFTSTYETWEEEMTVSRYYREKNFRPVKEGGRAFWSNRSFGGILLDAYRMPWGLKAQFMMAQPKDQNQSTRDGGRLYAYMPGDAEMAGMLDFRGRVLHGRIAKEKMLGGTWGINAIQTSFDPEIVYETEFLAGYTGKVPSLIGDRVVTMDYSGVLAKDLHFQIDVGVSQDDTVKFKKLLDDKDKEYYRHDKTLEVQADPVPGVYAKINNKRWSAGDVLLPMSLEAVYFPKNFNSPYGLVDDSRNYGWRRDEMYLNAGAFRYEPNLTGFKLKVQPNFNRGRFHVQYAQHAQIEEGYDHLVFEHRLNGRKVWESLHSWSKFNSALAIDSGRSESWKSDDYKSRVGLETASTTLKGARQDGGLRGGTWEVWEEYTAWHSAKDIEAENVPKSKKWSSFLSLDMGYDIGNWFGTDKAVMLSANMSWSGISTGFTPLSYSWDQDGMLLQSFYLQSEPAIALLPNFHILGIFGYQTVQGQLAWSKEVRSSAGVPFAEYYAPAPVDFIETALGFGFDWDFSARAGLHARFRYATHKDRFMPVNNWKGRFITTETKFWF